MIRECPLLSDRRTRVIYGRGDMEEGEVGMEGAEGFATGEEGDPDGEESEEDEEEEADSDGEDDESDDDDQDDGDDDDEEEEETEDSAEGEGEGDESEERGEGDLARQRQLARAASLAVSSATSSAAPSTAAFGSRSFGIGSPSPISAWQAHLLPRVFNVASSSPQPTAVVGNAHSTLSPSLLRSPSPSAPLLQPGMIALRTRSPLIPSSSLISSHGLATSATSTPAAAATSATSTPAAAATPASSTSASPPSTSAAAGAGGAVSTGGVGVAAAGEPGVGNGRIRVKTKALTKQAKHIMNILDAEATGALREQRNMPDFKPGDVLSMKIEVPENKRRTSIVKGIVIARRNAGIGSTFRIRRMLAGVGVEMSFPLYSPNIKEITVIGTRKVRRAKLYYLRDKVARMSAV
ncbi:unnamed protein product [Closterium sp. NIES-64]|nr:unnamed protein product [Closterium sp. NIES-64]